MIFKRKCVICGNIQKFDVKLYRFKKLTPLCVRCELVLLGGCVVPRGQIIETSRYKLLYNCLINYE